MFCRCQVRMYILLLLDRMFYVRLFGPLVNSVAQIVYFLIDYLENGTLKFLTIIVLLFIFFFSDFTSEFILRFIHITMCYKRVQHRCIYVREKSLFFHCILLKINCKVDYFVAIKIYVLKHKKFIL